jgi:hypothetical protein
VSAKNAKRLLLVVVVAAIAVAIILLSTGSPSCKRTLKDGSVIILTDVKIGRTNLVVHGTFLQKTLGRFLRSKQTMEIGKFKLTQPKTLVFSGLSNTESLTFQLHLLPGSAHEASYLRPAFYGKRRFVLYGDNGFPYFANISTYSGFNSRQSFATYGDGVFAAMSMYSFPRDSKLFHFRLEETDSMDKREWHELATFDIPNPHPTIPAHRDVDKSAHFKFAPNIEIEIGDLIFRNTTNFLHDLTQPRTQISARITKAGQIVTNWEMSEVWFDDALGNVERFIGEKTVTNGWISFSSYYALDPKTPWHFKVGFDQDSDLPTTNLFTFSTALPSNGTIATNFGPYRARLSTVNADVLGVDLYDKPDGMRLDLITATNAKGWKYRMGSASWGQHQFWKSMNSWTSPDGENYLEDTTNITVTLGIHPIYWAEFTLQPRSEK